MIPEPTPSDDVTERLLSLVARLHVCTDLRTALDEVLRATMALTGADMGNVQLVDRATGALEIVAQSGFDGAFGDHFRRVREGDGCVCSRAMASRTQVVVEDVLADPLFEPHREAASRARFRAVQSTPLLAVDGEVLGVLSTHFRAPHRPSARELRMIELYARQATGFIERMRTHAALRQVAAELAESDRRKDEFLALLAHELRNPLAPIRNGLQLLKLTGGDDPHVERTRCMMERQIEQMARLLDDLLDVSRISRGKITLRKERVQLAEIVHDAVETSRPLVAQMEHELTVTLPPQRVVLDADPTRLAQVFVNLLNNAAKYSERGGKIGLVAELRGDEVVVSVRDTGIGIAAEDLPRVFDIFAQVERSLEKASGGLGIGLTLARRLAEMHGGSVEARSEGLGKGSEFVVRLPVVAEARAPAGSEAARESPPCALQRVLVVDDNADCADSLALMLELLGSDAVTAYDGEQALAAAQTFQPEAVVLDIGLPKLDGYEVCRRLRRQPGGDNLVIIAQTGWGQDEDRRRTREAGFDHHVVKPVDPDALMELLATEVAARRQRRTG